MAVVLAAAVFSSCGRPVGYSEFRSTPSGVWTSADTLTFNVDTLRRGGRYALTLCLRAPASQPFPYHHLWLEARLGNLVADTARRDTLHLALVAPNGRSLGRGIAVHQYEIPFDTLQLLPGASGRISLRHIMRRDSLPGISEVGVVLQELE